MSDNSVWRRLAWCVPIALAAVAVLGTEVRAGPAAADSVFTAAREAVARGRTERTALAGFGAGGGDVADDPPEGGVLVGFEIGLGEFVKKPTIYSLRPLYLTPNSVFPSRTFGLAQGRRGAGRNVKSKVTRTVTIQARPGYAVGQVAVDSGLNIDGIAITFMRIKGTALDPQQSYTEDWVGTHQGKPAKVLGGDGAPVVGVFARQDEVRVMAFGLIQMRPAEAAAPAPAPPPSQKADARPAPAPRPPEDVVDVNRPIRPAGKPAAPPPVAAEPSPPEPEKADAPAPAAADEDDDGGLSWLPFVVFGAVSVPLFLGLMVVLRRKEPARRDRDEGAEVVAKPRRGAAKSTDLCESPAAGPGAPQPDETGICAAPGVVLPEVLPADDDAEAEPNEPPPYFEARAVFNFRPNRLFRVYVLPDRLLFLETDDGALPAWAAPVVAAGLLFGLIGGLVAWSIIKSLNQRPTGRRYELDSLDAEELTARATCEKGSFPAEPDDLSEVRLEVPSHWHCLWWANHHCPGLLRLRHREHGSYTLQFLDPMGMKLAFETLPQLLGRRVDVRVWYSQQLGRFVSKD